MDKYVTLIGAEEVSRAASSMRSAADEMKNAAWTIDGSLERHQRFMDDWLQRFESALQAAPTSAEGEDHGGA